MPHVSIRAYPGRTEEQKQALAKAIAEDVIKYFEVPEAAVSVSIKEIAPEDWKEEAVDGEMLTEGTRLLKTPGYDID
ncbi:MAG: tautomerase family protein [Oscillospiraceae bacterium]|nr:tautomerase family protein [Oscillospiraceae bacterium]MBR2806725.1 tautomerase family protein [Oscillospiraceae bacterium]